MKSFDIIDSAGFGYKTVWDERRYLAKLALVPIMLKLACAVIVYAYGYETNFLRQALVTLPATLAEGWLLAQFLRTLLTHERWPIYLKEEPSEQQMSALLLRARGIISCALMFTLIVFIEYGFKEIYMRFYEVAQEAGKAGADGAPAEGNPLLFFPAFALLLFTIWTFRLLWLYIPAVVLMPIRSFLVHIKGFGASLRMIAVYLICVMPCLLVALFLLDTLSSLAGGADTDIGRFSMISVNVVIDTIGKLIATAAIAYAFRSILPKHPNALPDVTKNEN